MLGKSFMNNLTKTIHFLNGKEASPSKKMEKLGALRNISGRALIIAKIRLGSMYMPGKYFNLWNQQGTKDVYK